MPKHRTYYYKKDPLIIVQRVFSFLRREGDSNPRYAFDVYTLSRRAAFKHKQLIFNMLQAAQYRIAVYLRFFGFGTSYNDTAI